MRCPYCHSLNDKVVDSRSTKDDSEIRRRRECEDCGKRFTTYERIEEMMLIVKKKNGEREPFDKNKIKKGLMTSCQKRSVSADKIDQIIDIIEKVVQATDKKEIDSSFIGNLVMQELKKIDMVAYIRFASVYKEFRDASDFIVEVNEIDTKDET